MKKILSGVIVFSMVLSAFHVNAQAVPNESGSSAATESPVFVEFANPSNPNDVATLEIDTTTPQEVIHKIDQLSAEAKKTKINLDTYAMDTPEILESSPTQTTVAGLKERLLNWKNTNKERIKMTIYRGLFNAVPTALGIIISPVDYHMATLAFATTMTFSIPAWFQYHNTKIQDWVNKGNLMTVFILKRLLLVSGIYNLLFVGVPILIENTIGSGPLPNSDLESFVIQVVKYSIATVVGQGAIEFGINKMRNQLIGEDPENYSKYNHLQARTALWTSGLMAAVIIADMTGFELKDYVNAALISAGVAANVIAQPSFFQKIKGYIRNKLGIASHLCQNLFVIR